MVEKPAKKDDGVF